MRIVLLATAMAAAPGHGGTSELDRPRLWPECMPSASGPRPAAARSPAFQQRRRPPASSTRPRARIVRIDPSSTPGWAKPQYAIATPGRVQLRVLADAENGDGRGVRVVWPGHRGGPNSRKPARTPTISPQACGPRAQSNRNACGRAVADRLVPAKRACASPGLILAFIASGLGPRPTLRGLRPAGPAPPMAGSRRRMAGEGGWPEVSNVGHPSARAARRDSSTVAPPCPAVSPAVIDVDGAGRPAVLESTDGRRRGSPSRSARPPTLATVEGSGG
jgi:hypothetical protein